MGLPTPGSDSKKGYDKRFSGDVLKIEVFGPKQLHLSVVDVPGLFHSEFPYAINGEVIACVLTRL